MFGLWQAVADGGKNLVPKAWGGRFPFQVKVALASPEIISLAKAILGDAFLDPATGKFHNIIEGESAEALLRMVQQAS